MTHVFITTWLDCCSVFFVGISQASLSRLQLQPGSVLSSLAPWTFQDWFLRFYCVLTIHWMGWLRPISLNSYKHVPARSLRSPRQLDGQDVEMGRFYNIWLALPFSSEILLLPCFINHKRCVLCLIVYTKILCVQGRSSYDILTPNNPFSILGIKR